MSYRSPHRVLLIGKQFNLPSDVQRKIDGYVQEAEFGGVTTVLQKSFRRFITMLKRLRELRPNVCSFRNNCRFSDLCHIWPECDRDGVLTGPHSRLGTVKTKLDVSKYWNSVFSPRVLEGPIRVYEASEDRRMWGGGPRYSGGGSSS